MGQRDEDLKTQAESFSGWFALNSKWQNPAQMAVEIDIPRATLRGYMKGEGMARGRNRKILFGVTRLPCFAPHPDYDQERPGRGQSGVQKEAKPRVEAPPKKAPFKPPSPTSLSGSLDGLFRRLVQEAVTDAIPSVAATNCQPIITALGRLEAAIGELTDSLTAPTAKTETTAPAAVPARTETAGEDKAQPMIVLRDLPAVTGSVTAIGQLRSQIIAITRSLAAHSNLRENSPEREAARQELLPAVQQLFIVVLLFDKQFPSDFAHEAERFRQLLHI